MGGCASVGQASRRVGTDPADVVHIQTNNFLSPKAKATPTASSVGVSRSTTATDQSVMSLGAGGDLGDSAMNQVDADALGDETPASVSSPAGVWGGSAPTESSAASKVLKSGVANHMFVPKGQLRGLRMRSTSCASNSSSDSDTEELAPNDYLEEIDERVVESDSEVDEAVQRAEEIDEFVTTSQDFAQLRALKVVFDRAGLDDDQQKRFLSTLLPAQFTDGDYIVRQGDMGDKFFLVTEGQVCVSRNESPEKSVHLYQGSFFGEFSLLREEPRNANVCAVGDVKCLYVTKDVFKPFVEADMKFKQLIVELMLRREQASRKRSELDTAGSPHRVSLLRPRQSDVKMSQRRQTHNRDMVNEYVVIRTLGRGAYGVVKLVQSLVSRQMFALKVIDRNMLRKKRLGASDEEFQREIAIMKKLQHNNVVNLFEVIEDPVTSKLYLVEEFVENGPIMTESEYNKPIDPSLAWLYFRDVLKGIEYLHAQGIYHRDLKPSNILVSRDGRCKISDFGVAAFSRGDSDNLTDVRGTPAFMAPELFAGGVYSGSAADMWSLGATLYTLVVGMPPYIANDEFELVKKLHTEKPKFPQEVEELPDLKHLLLRLMTVEPGDRATLQEAMQHEWVTEEGSNPLEITHYRQVSASDTEVSSALHDTVPADEVLDELAQRKTVRRQLTQKTFQEMTGLAPLQEATGGDRSDSLTPSGLFSNKSIRSVDSTHDMLRAVSYQGHQMQEAVNKAKTLPRVWSAPCLRQSFAEMLKHVRLTDVRMHAILNVNHGAGFKTLATSVPAATRRTPSMQAVRSLTIPSLSATGASGASTAEDVTLSKFRRHSSDNAVLLKAGTVVVVQDKLYCVTAQGALRKVDNRVETTRTHRLQAHPGMTSRSSSASSSTLSSVQSFRNKHTLLQQSHLSGSIIMRNDITSNADLVTAHLRRLRERQMKLLAGHKGLTPEERDSLIEQRRVALSSQRADVTVADLGSSDDHDLQPSASGERGNLSEDEHDRRKSTTLSRKPDFIAVKLPTSKGGKGNKAVIFQAVGDGSLSVASNTPLLTPNSSNLGGFPSTSKRTPRHSSSSRAGSRSSTRASSPRHSNSNSNDDIDIQDVVEVSDSDSSSDDLSDIEEVADEGMEDLWSELCLPAFAPSDARMEPLSDEELRAWAKCRKQCCTNSPSNRALALSHGSHESIGGRHSMEDAMTEVDNLGTELGLENSASVSQAWFGVYDGHNGDETSAWLKKRLHVEVARQPTFDNNVEQAILDAFHKTDEEFLDMAAKEEVYSGSTATTLFVRQADHFGGVKLYCANVGDSRTVLSRDGVAFDMSVDHKPSRPDEKERITAAGGWVHNGRVHGVLAVSRAFGDIEHKKLSWQISDETSSTSLTGPSNKVLISEPEIVTETVLPSDEFVVLACDGLWDVMTSQQVVNFVRRALTQCKDAGAAAESLVRMAVNDLNSPDNVSAMIVVLNQAWEDETHWNATNDVYRSPNKSQGETTPLAGAGGAGAGTAM